MPQYPQKTVVDGVALVTLTLSDFELLMQAAKAQDCGSLAVAAVTEPPEERFIESPALEDALSLKFEGRPSRRRDRPVMRLARP